MEIETILGLPAHALLVHAAVILVPLAAVALAATCWKPTWRRNYSLPIALLAIAGAVFAFLAKGSGEPLEHAVKDAAREAGVEARFGDHPGQGDTAFIFAMVFAIAATALWAADRFGTRWTLPKWAPSAAYGVAMICGALALTTMFIAGHSGAELVWKDVGSFTAGK